MCLVVTATSSSHLHVQEATTTQAHIHVTQHSQATWPVQGPELHMGLHAYRKICGYRKKVKFIRIDGSTPPETRAGLVDKFQLNSDVRVAILSINAAGTGLTLTVATSELSVIPVLHK